MFGQHPWPAPTVPLGAAKSAQMSVSRSQLQQIESKPKAHRGENVIVYAQVATIDPGPWDDRFLGYAAERPITQDSFLSCLDYARFTGAHAALNNLVENDVVKVLGNGPGSGALRHPRSGHDHPLPVRQPHRHRRTRSVTPRPAARSHCSAGRGGLPLHVPPHRP